MGLLDIVLGLLLAYGLYKGFRNGLFVEIASLIAIIAGLYGAFHFSYLTSDYLSDRLNWDGRYLNIIAFITTFLIIVVLVNMAGKLLTKIANFAMLGVLNKIAGAIFGALKAGVILGALLLFFDRANTSLQLVEPHTLEESVLYDPVKTLGEFVFSAVLPEKEAISEQIE